MYKLMDKPLHLLYTPVTPNCDFTATFGDFKFGLVAGGRVQSQPCGYTEKQLMCQSVGGCVESWRNSHSTFVKCSFDNIW